LRRNLDLYKTIWSCKRSLSRRPKCSSIQVIALSHNLKQVELLGRIQQLHIGRNALGKPNLAIRIVDLLLAFKEVELDQVDRESIRLAVEIRSHQFLLS